MKYFIITLLALAVPLFTFSSFMFFRNCAFSVSRNVKEEDERAFFHLAVTAAISASVIVVCVLFLAGLIG